ncbi:MAG: MBG domain-containing protein, partial [Bacilli bacterium]
FPDEEISGELALVEAESGLPVDTSKPLPVGEYLIKQGTLQTPPENYICQFTPGHLTVNKCIVSVHALDSGKTAGTVDPVLEYEITAGTLAVGDEFSGQLRRVTGENPGMYPIRQGTLSLNSNYELVFTEGVFTVSAAPSTRSGAGVSSAAVFALPQSSSFIEDTGMEIPKEDWIQEEGFVGAAAIHDDDQLQEDESLLVQIQAVSCEKSFGNADPQFQYRVVSGGEAGVVLQGHPDRLPGEDAGTYTIQQGTLHCTGAAKMQFIPGTFRILPGTVTVLGLDQQKYQGESDPPLTWKLKESGSGAVQVTGQLARGKGEQSGVYEIRQGTLQVSGRNHVLVYEPGHLTILPPVYVARGVQAENLVYGQALKHSKLTGEVIFTDGQQQQNGEFIWQQPDLLPESGVRIAAWNFIFADFEAAPLQGECRLTVLPKPLKVSGACQEKQQGQQDPELLYHYDSEDLPDAQPEITGKLARASGERAGVYATSLGTLSFGPNYQLDFAPGRLLIQAETIIINAAWNLSKKTGDSIEFAGETYRFGADALADLSEALERIAPGGNILVLPGEYASPSGEWKVEKKLRLQGLRRDERFPVLQSVLQIEGASASGIVIEGFAFVQERQIPGSSALIIRNGASSIQVRDNVFLGGNPSIQAAGISDLTLRNNIIESPSAGLMFGHPADRQSSCRGVLLLQNVLRPSSGAGTEYRHILLYDDNINTTGILPAWDNCFAQMQISGREDPAILAEVKKQIADKDQKGWPGKGEVRLQK